MPVTVTAQKTVSSRSPYIGRTFQRLAEGLAGREGYLAGFTTTDDTVTVEATTGSFLQRGFVVDSLEAVAGLAVPALPEPWFLVGSAADDDPASGVEITVTTSLTTALTGVVLAYKTEGVWRNPLGTSIASLQAKASDSGVEGGAVPGITADGGGAVTELTVSGGLTVGPAGFRRPLVPGATQSAKSYSGSPVPANPEARRLDLLVLRELEEETSVLTDVIATVGASSESSLSAGSSGTKFGYYAKRDGALADEWFVRGSGSDILARGGRAGEGFTEVTVATVGGTVTDVWVAGQRAADDAIIVVYTAGDVGVLSFNATTGALVDAATVIDTQPNSCLRARAALDGDEALHVTYEHDEGVDQQVYYTKRSIAVASFGAAAITPIIAAGSSTGNNDTFPDIDVDRRGRAHIVYATGSTGNAFGDLAYLVIDQNGNVATNNLLQASADIGKETDAVVGFEATAYSSIARPRVAITPFDEVFVAMVADESGGTDQVLLYSPGFKERLGFEIVNLPFPVDMEYSCEIIASELGTLHVFSFVDVGAFTAYYHNVVDTTFAPEGRLGNSVLSSVSIGGPAIAGPTDAETDFSVHRGHAGALRVCHLNSGSAEATEASVLILNDREPTPSPKDLVLGAAIVPAEATGAVERDTISVFAARPKKMNYPFLVGNEGDFFGVGSLGEAVERANEVGGEIIIRKGDYRNSSFSALTLRSGVSVRGEGQVYLGNRVFTIQNKDTTPPVTVDNISGNVIEFAATYATREGDLVELGGPGSGYHKVIARLPATATYATRLLLSNSSPGDAVPSGTEASLFQAGSVLENLSFEADASARIFVRSCLQPIVRNISFHGTHTNFSSAALIEIADCYAPLIENIDASLVTAGGTSAVVVRLDNNLYPVARAIRGSEGQMEAIDVYTDNVEPVLADMTNMKIAASNGGSRTTPMLVTNVDDGDATGITDDTDRHTAVGNVVKVPGTGDALHFQDANTRSGAVRDVPLTDDTDVDGQQLPAAFGTTTPPESIFRALREPQHKQREQFGSAFLSGGNPALATFPRVDIGAASYFANGIQLDTGALFNDDGGTFADQTYYYYLNDAGAVTRSTAFTPESETLALVCSATVNGANSGWIEIRDLRMFYGKAHRKGALVVGFDSEFAHFKTLAGALRYLELTADEQLAHIVLADQTTVIASDLPFAINFQTSNIKSFKLEGVGDNAGILVADGSTSDVFSFTGVASKNAAGGSGQKNSVIIENILIDNAQTTVPVTTGETTIRLDDGYFTDVAVRSVRTMSKDGPISNFMYVDPTCIVDMMEVQGCVIDDVTVDGVHVEGTVDNLFVSGNEMRMDRASAANTRGVYVGEDVKRAIVEKNFIGPGRNAANGSFHDGMEIFSTDGDNLGNARVIRDNLISCVGSTPDPVSRGIQVRSDSGAPSKDGSIVIEGNRIEGAWFNGIDTYDIRDSAEVVIRGNIIIAPFGSGIRMYGTTGEVVTGNHIREMALGNGIFAELGSVVIGDNKVIGLQGASSAIDIGNDSTSLDRLSSIAGNIIEGDWQIGILNDNRGTSIVGNRIRLDNTTAGFPIGIDSTATANGVSMSGNTIESTHLGIRSVTDGTVCSGNNVLVTDSSTLAADAHAFLFDISSGTASCVVTGSRFEIPVETATAADSAVVKIAGNAEDCIFNGNWVKAYVGADYSGTGPGQHALFSEAIRQSVIGNFFENQGQGDTKATVRFNDTGGTSALIGNIIRNTNSVAADHFDNATGTVDYGRTEGTEPGTNSFLS